MDRRAGRFEKKGSGRAPVWGSETGALKTSRDPPERAPPAQSLLGRRFRGRHLSLTQRQIATEFGRSSVTVDEAESPLAWLARRRGRNGRALIEAHQLQAGERLRADFTGEIVIAWCR